MGIVWIASYPKSGNTWLRFLLANYLIGPIESSEQVERLIPGFNHGTDGMGLVANRGVVYGKSHDKWGPGHPCSYLTDRAVVVLRHPKDVLLSGLNYQSITGKRSAGFSPEEYVTTFIRCGGDPKWIDAGYGTLEEHTSSWMDGRASPPRLFVRYETLKADAPGELRRVVQFLGLSVDEAQLAMAVERSGFEQMRAIEVRERRDRKFSPLWGDIPIIQGRARYFMNEGRITASLHHINPGLDRAFDQRFAGLIERLGYRKTG